MRRAIGSLLLTIGLLLVGGAFAGTVAGGGCHAEPAEPSDAASSIVRIEACAFGPTVTRVPIGTTVTFANADQVAHNVVGSNWGDGRDLMPGQTTRHGFRTAGIFPYSCTFHPGMNGAVVVGVDDTALAAATTPVAPTTPARDGGSPVGMALAGAGGLAIGAIGAGLLLRRRSGDESAG
jgi:plastocyanin